MKAIKRLFFTGIFLFSLTTTGFGQTVVAFQGGEGTAADTWAYSAIFNAGGPLFPGIVGTYPRTGSYCLRAGGGNTVGCSSGVNCIYGGGAVGCPAHSKVIQFNTVNVACLSDVQLSLYHRSHDLCAGNGFDSGEFLYFEVKLNGGSWITVGSVAGFNEYTWTYATSPAGVSITAPNPFIYNIPAGTSTFDFKVRTNTNRGDEVFYIDDVKLTTSTTLYSFPGTSGLWSGVINTNWNNVCNWENRVLPTTLTDVLIPNSATNLCEVLASNTGNCRNLIVDKAKLAVENLTSTLNVTGNLTIETNGELDLSLNSTQGGTINLSGEWLNKRTETEVTEDGSTVNFTGTNTQIITVTNDTKEAYYKMRIDKSAGTVIANDNIWIDPNNNGGAAGMLNLVNGPIDLNAKEMIVWNPNPSAIIRTNGGIISERTNNQSRLTWKTGSVLGSYTFPFIKISGNYIPLIIQTVSGSAGQITAATYGTPSNNLPWPVSPVLVQNLVSSMGLSPDNRDATVDRYWQIDVPGSTTANLTFNYAASELPVAPYNVPASIKAQRYEPGTNAWQPYLPGQSAGAYFTNVPLVSLFSTWTLSNELSSLPVELLTFTAVLNKKNDVDLFWATASEINNDYFTLEKSKDGFSFEGFESIKGAGNSTTVSHYQFTDEDPFNGISYYRLKQTDFDGLFSYSEIAAVRMNQHANNSFHIFPNPADDYFYVRFDKDQPVIKLYIKEMNGKTIREYDFQNSEIVNEGLIKIQRMSLSAGMYLIETNMGSIQKLVLQ